MADGSCASVMEVLEQGFWNNALGIYYIMYVFDCDAVDDSKASRSY